MAEGRPEVELVAVFISPGHSYWGRQGEGRMQHGVVTPTEVECLAGRGLRGDRYFDKPNQRYGHVTLFDEAVWQGVRERFRLPRLPAGVFRRNLLVRGVSLEALLGERFMVQGVEMEGAQECKPCVWMDRAVSPGVQAYLAEAFRGGLRARVLGSGVLRPVGVDAVQDRK